MSIRVIRRLQTQGHKAYWVGGCVRDELLGRPVKDRDVATDAVPSEVRKAFPRSRSLGERFGVVIVRDHGALTEVATFRRESGYRDGRRPDKVIFTTDPNEDVLRRDFTVNAVLHDPIADVHIDLVEGMADLRRGLIRTVGSPRERFGEDRLRMLRAVRLAAKLGFRIEEGTMQGIRAWAHKITSVAAERVRDELSRILTEGSPRQGFELLEQSGLLERLLPEVRAMRGVEQPPQFHPEGDVWTHTMLMLDGLREPSVPLAWGILLHDIGKPATFSKTDRIRFHGHARVGVGIARRICRRLRFSNAWSDRVLALVANHMRFLDVRRMKRSTLRRFAGLPHFDEHLELHRQDCLSSGASLDGYDHASEHFRSLQDEGPGERLLTGHDLKKAGYVPGPIFGQILSKVETLRLDGSLTTRDDALRFVSDQYPLPVGDRSKG
ncbi:MAG: CCA tRNA nucleotidyltransferase [Bryobacterales bacterium]|nr:CCA tRNA nucleotidyltransferase [Bryobacterales bacterium]